jgi:hypothetical protein
MRFDRTGYPPPEDGYKVHAHSSIIPVADCYDALTTMRSYQKARLPHQSLEIMTKRAGKSLDPFVVAAFAKTVGAYPIGTMVRLNTMEIGLVVGQGEEGEDLPKIMVLLDGDGRPLGRPEHVDLAKPDGSSDRRRSIVGIVNPNLYAPVAAGSLSATLTPALALQEN